MKNKIFNKHFLGMISTFALVIIGVTVFITFLEEALVKDKTLNSKITQNINYGNQIS